MAKVNNIVEDPIMEFFNKNSFMKVKPDGFRIGRLLLSFGNMDDNKKLVPGSNIDYWLDFKKGDAFNLMQDIISGKLAVEVKKEKKDRLAANPNAKYAQPVRSYQGGVSAQKAKDKNLRTDGAAQAKILKIQGGLKQPVLISVEEGPGRETEQGLIVPTYNGKPEQIVRVTLTWDDLKAMALAVQMHYNAFLAGQHVMKAIADEKAARERLKENKNAA